VAPGVLHHTFEWYRTQICRDCLKALVCRDAKLLCLCWLFRSGCAKVLRGRCNNNVALFSVQKENDGTWNAFWILMDIWCKCRFDGIVRVLLMGDIFTSFYLYNEESVGLLQLHSLKSSKLGTWQLTIPRQEKLQVSRYSLPWEHFIDSFQMTKIFTCAPALVELQMCQLHSTLPQ